MVALDKTIIDQATQRGMRKVLIATALPLEMRAVRAHLTEIGSYRTRDGNFVELGQFSAAGQDWFAVVVESGAGNHEAQNAYVRRQHPWHRFRVEL